MRFDTNIQVKIRDAYRARHEPEAERILGQFYWAVLISFFAMSVVASIGYGVWEFMRPESAIPESSASLGAKKTLTRPDLQKVLEAFDQRATKYENRRIAPVLVRDPS